MSRHAIDLTGQKFGRLTVKKLHSTTAHGAWWVCQCECGQETLGLASNLKCGGKKSCGCLRREAPHCKRRGPEYLALRQQWRTLREIAAACGVSPQSVYFALKKMPGYRRV